MGSFCWENPVPIKFLLLGGGSGFFLEGGGFIFYGRGDFSEFCLHAKSKTKIRGGGVSHVKPPSEGYRAIGGGGIAAIVSRYIALYRATRWPTHILTFFYFIYLRIWVGAALSGCLQVASPLLHVRARHWQQKIVSRN